MEKLLDNMLNRLKDSDVRGMVVFMDDDDEVFSASTAPTKRIALRCLAYLAIDEARRQSATVAEVLDNVSKLAKTIEANGG